MHRLPVKFFATHRLEQSKLEDRTKQRASVNRASIDPAPVAPLETLPSKLLASCMWKGKKEERRGEKKEQVRQGSSSARVTVHIKQKVNLQPFRSRLPLSLGEKPLENQMYSTTSSRIHYLLQPPRPHPQTRGAPCPAPSLATIHTLGSLPNGRIPPRRPAGNRIKSNEGSSHVFLIP